MRGQPSRGVAGSPREDLQQPSYVYPDYVATRLRAPQKPLIILPQTLSDLTGPAYRRGSIGELDNDLTRQHGGEPLGERIFLTGRVLDADGRPVRRSLIEIWRANADMLDGKLTAFLPQLSWNVIRLSRSSTG